MYERMLSVEKKVFWFTRPSKVSLTPVRKDGVMGGG